LMLALTISAILEKIPFAISRLPQISFSALPYTPSAIVIPYTFGRPFRKIIIKKTIY
jgi:hypothetical protein